MRRFFTFSQAQELLPVVKGLIEQAVESKSDYERAQGIAQATMSRVSMLGGAWVDREAFARNDRLKNSSLERLKSAVEQIHGMGVQVKDLDMGLIDFPTLFRERKCISAGGSGSRKSSTGMECTKVSEVARRSMPTS